LEVRNPRPGGFLCFGIKFAYKDFQTLGVDQWPCCS